MTFAAELLRLKRGKLVLAGSDLSPVRLNARLTRLSGRIQA